MPRKGASNNKASTAINNNNNNNLSNSKSNPKAPFQSPALKSIPAKFNPKSKSKTKTNNKHNSNSNSNSPLTNAINNLTPLFESPEEFLTSNPELCTQLQLQTKLLYDYSKSLETSEQQLTTSLNDSLPVLLLDGFNNEQIWQQLQLQNQPVIDHLTKKFKQFQGLISKAHQKKNVQPEKLMNDDELDAALDAEVDEMDNEQDQSDDDNNDNNLNENDEEEQQKPKAKQSRSKSNHVQQEDGGDNDNNNDIGEEDEDEYEDEVDNEDELDENDNEEDDNDNENNDANDNEDENDENNDDIDEDDGNLEEFPDDDVNDESNSEQQQTKPSKSNKKRKTNKDNDGSKTVSDDAFFSFAEMERFADEYDDVDDDTNNRYNDYQESDNESQIVDLDADVGEIDMTKGEKYSAFFDPPSKSQLKGQSLKEGLDEEDNEVYNENDNNNYNNNDDPNDEWSGFFARTAAQKRDKELQAKQEIERKQREKTMSTHEKQAEYQKQIISQLESTIVKPREWQYSGEKTARDRPQDSLLELNLEYDRATKEKEIITPQVTKQIEEIIKKRIIEQQFNDPQRKLPNVEKEYKVREELSTEKSKLGLAELYEQEYKDKTAIDQGRQTKLQEKKSIEHAEISKIFAELCYQLDSLSNFNFTPKPPHLEITVSSNSHAKSIEMEEIIPVAVSDKQLNTIKQTYTAKNTNGQAIGDHEKTREEKKRKRRDKKSKFKKQQLQEKQNNPNNNTNNNNNNNNQNKPNKMSKADINNANNARNVKQGVNVDNVNYSKSNEVFSLIQQVAKDAEREEKQNKKDRK